MKIRTGAVSFIIGTTMLASPLLALATTTSSVATISSSVTAVTTAASANNTAALIAALQSLIQLLTKELNLLLASQGTSTSASSSSSATSTTQTSATASSPSTTTTTTTTTNTTPTTTGTTASSAGSTASNSVTSSSGTASVSTVSGAPSVYPGCAVPPTSPTGHVWYIDAVNGSPTGDGSAAHPLDSLNALFTAASNDYAGHQNWMVPNCQALTTSSGVYSRCTSGPLLATVPYYHYDPTLGYVTSVNPNAPIKPGDIIMLMSGNYGDIHIDVYNNQIANSDFITVEAAPGQTPVLSSLYIGATNKWYFKNLKIQSLRGNASYAQLLYITGSAGFPNQDIVLDGLSISSADDVSSWTQSYWGANGRSGVIVRGMYGPDQSAATCTTLENSKIYNVTTGVQLMAAKTLFTNNTINNFADDALDFAGNNLLITHNTITNSNDLNDGNHEDAMQGQIGEVIPGVASNLYHDITIDSNTVIRQTDPHLKFPSYLQGISTFNSDWNNLTVTNNLVVTCAWHGITFGGVHGGLIANNTLVNDGCDGANATSTNPMIAWIDAGSDSNNIIVRNNIAPTVNIETSSITWDHNIASHMIYFVDASGGKNWNTAAGVYGNSNTLIPTLFNSGFAKIDTTNNQYDLHLLAGNPAIGAGSADQAPTVDITGVTRTLPIDLGAYAYTGAKSSSGASSSATPKPTATLSVSPTSIAAGSSATLTWSSTNATSCTGSGFTASGVNGSVSVAPTANASYSISCTGSGGSASAQTSVTVTAAQQSTTSSSNTSVVNGLVLHLPFDQSTVSASTASDTSGNAFNGTLVNAPTLVSGTIGQALSFNGTNQGVSLGSLPLSSLGITKNAMTISAWVKPQDLTSPTQIIIGKGATASAPENETFVLYLNKYTSRPVADFSDGNNTILRVGATSGPTDTVGTWMLVTAVLNGQSATIYLNGVAAGSVTDSNFGTLADAGAGRGAGVGYDAAATRFYMTGLVDDVRIYNRALSASEISQLYAGTLAQTPTSQTAAAAASSDALSRMKDVLEGLLNILQSLKK